jgi:hypothetical protein
LDFIPSSPFCILPPSSEDLILSISFWVPAAANLPGADNILKNPSTTPLAPLRLVSTKFVALPAIFPTPVTALFAAVKVELVKLSRPLKALDKKPPLCSFLTDDLS